MDEKQLITTRKTINDLISKALCNLQLKNHAYHTKENTWPQLVMWAPPYIDQTEYFNLRKIMPLRTCSSWA